MREVLNYAAIVLFVFGVVGLAGLLAAVFAMSGRQSEAERAVPISTPSNGDCV